MCINKTLHNITINQLYIVTIGKISVLYYKILDIVDWNLFYVIPRHLLRLYNLKIQVIASIIVSIQPVIHVQYNRIEQPQHFYS